MSPKLNPVAIVDYGLGNVFSVLRACERVGLQAQLTQNRQDILAAPAVILPGVGAFGDAMNTLTRLDLVSVIQEVAISGTPLLGICLGLQLLMSESQEFGQHKGLGVIKGDVIRLETATTGALALKVPQVGWNHIAPSSAKDSMHWEDTLLKDVPSGEFMYFVHSFYVRPIDNAVILSQTQYGSNLFCSSVQQKNVFACQFHPERSGPAGLRIYQNLFSSLKARSSMEDPYVEHVNR